MNRRSFRFATMFVFALALALGGAAPGAEVREPRISEFGPTFRSPISNIIVAPDGILWVEEDDGIARVTRDGHVTEIRQPDDCSICSGSGIGIGPNQRIWKNGGDLALRLRGHAFERFARSASSDRSAMFSAFAASRDGVYLGTASGTIVALRANGDLKNLETKSGAIKNLAARPGALWIDSGSSLDFLSGNIARHDLGQRYFAERAIIVMAAGNDESAVAIVQDQNPGVPPGGSATVVRVARTGDIREFAHLSAYEPWRRGAITVAPDGTIWFTQPSENRVASIGSNGVRHEFRLGIPSGAVPTGIAADRDGSIWFTDAARGQVDHLERGGKISIIGSGLNPANAPGAPIETPDGAIWFVQTLSWHPRVTRIAPDGAVREYKVGESLGDSLQALGNGVIFRTGDNTPSLAFHELQADGSTRPAPVNGCLVTSFNVACFPHRGHKPLSCVDSFPNSAVLAPDGNIWYTAQSTIGRISPDGRCRSFSSGLTRWHSGPQYLTVGPNRTLWFTEVRDRVGSITLDGNIREYSAGIPLRSSIGGIVAAPDGNVWFTLYHGNELARLRPGKRIERFRKGIYPSSGSDYGPDSVPSFDRQGRIVFNEPQGGRIARAVIK